jgi:pimeloyl-ACP methyl ester carboxylesterase
LGSARDIAGSKLITLKGVGHAVQNVAPDAVIEAIVDVAERADARVAQEAHQAAH